jgi:tetratricopeptide (TPR) repeat protein
MANMLRRAQGFTLAFAQCNQPSERRRLVSELRQRLGDYRIAEVEFTEPIENLLDELIPRLFEYNDARALFVYGLEHSIRSDQDFSPMVANLNISRNLFPRHISYPIVLWLPAYAIAAVMRGAPDFFSWRSAVFQFPSSPEMLVQVAQNALSGGFLSALNLTAEEKEARIAVIEDILVDYGPLYSDRRDRRVEGRLLDRLTFFHYSLGDYRQAEEYCQQSLKIAQELDDRSGIASSLNNLGVIADFRGDYEQAEDYHQQSLKIAQELGDRSRIVDSLQNLGIIARYRRNYEQAVDYFQRSLRIAQELGNRDGIAGSLHNLGNIAYLLGDYQRAEDYYQQSLRISQELGDRRGIASSLIQLTSLYAEQGDIDMAVRLTTIARDIFAEIGSNLQEMAQEQLVQLQEQVESQHFEMLVREAQADPEKVIREAIGAVEN